MKVFIAVSKADPQKKAYILYTRDSRGGITRHPINRVMYDQYSVKHAFPFVEKLVGYPEPTVRWQYETGRSSGYAEEGV
jgi:hypothetical protein